MARLYLMMQQAEIADLESCWREITVVVEVVAQADVEGGSDGNAVLVPTIIDMVHRDNHRDSGAVLPWCLPE